MGWLMFAGAVLLLAVLPLGVWVRYDGDGPLVRIVAGPIRLTVFPAKRKKKQPKPEQKKEPAPKAAGKKENLPKPPAKPKQQKKEEKPKGGSLLDFLPLVKLGVDLLGDFRRKLRVDELYLRLSMASSDPCDLAVNYGRAWAAVGNLMPQLERFLVIKKRDIEVACDFTASQTLVNAQLKITITLGRLLGLLTVYGFRGIQEFLKIKKKRKGGAAT